MLKIWDRGLRSRLDVYYAYMQGPWRQPNQGGDAHQKYLDEFEGFDDLTFEMFNILAYKLSR